MNKLISISPVMTGQYKHDYYIFEYYQDNGARRMPDENFLLSYSYQYSNNNLTSFLDNLIQEDVPAVKYLLRDLQVIRYNILRDKGGFRVLSILHDVEDLIFTFSKYLAIYAIPWIKSHLRNAYTTHNLTGYLGHFSIFTENISTSIAKLSFHLDRAAIDSEDNSEENGIGSLREKLQSFTNTLKIMVERITDAQSEHINPTNQLTLN